MSTKYEPVANNILVEAVKVSTTITIPGTVEPEEYNVVATGIDVKHVAAGQKVIISSTALTVPIRNTSYALTNADNVLCVVK
jgi:hypothetical protein